MADADTAPVARRPSLTGLGKPLPQGTLPSLPASRPSGTGATPPKTSQVPQQSGNGLPVLAGPPAGATVPAPSILTAEPASSKLAALASRFDTNLDELKAKKAASFGVQRSRSVPRSLDRSGAEAEHTSVRKLRQRELTPCKPLML
jgi:hypothetical protein